MILEKAEFTDIITQIIEYCKSSGEPPVSHVVRDVAGISEQELNKLRDVPEFADQIERLDEFRTYYWLRKGIEDPRYASFATFNLKQSMNGGFNDKPSGSGVVTVRVMMDGVGEDAFM